MAHTEDQHERETSMSEQPPSGWYPDPAKAPGKNRWWDGRRWTDRTQDAPAAPPSAAPTQQPLRRAAWFVLAAGVLAVVGGLLTGSAHRYAGAVDCGRAIHPVSYDRILFAHSAEACAAELHGYRTTYIVLLIVGLFAVALAGAYLLWPNAFRIGPVEEHQSDDALPTIRRAEAESDARSTSASLGWFIAAAVTGAVLLMIGVGLVFAQVSRYGESCGTPVASISHGDTLAGYFVDAECSDAIRDRWWGVAVLVVAGGAVCALGATSAVRAARNRPRSGSVADDLSEVSRLHAGGMLSDAEFAAAKARVLGVDAPRR